MVLLPRAFLVSLACLTLLLFAAAPAARAQTWLAPAYGDRAPLGAAKAKGAVLWLHGRSVNSEDSQAATPPYMAALAEDGWDAYRFNRMRRSDTLGGSTAALVAEVRRLKAMGYRQVALAGQSFGAFIALMTADASDDVDAVIATAPAAYGSFGEFYDSWRSNATKLYPLLEKVRRARVMLFYFHGDDFDPGGRGERSRDILAQRHLAYVVIDQPPQLTTHWAATTPLFVHLYGSCLVGFLDEPDAAPGTGCQRDALWAGAADTVPREPSPAPVASIQGSAQRKP